MTRRWPGLLIAIVLVVSPWPLGARLPWIAMTIAAVVIAMTGAWLATRLWHSAPPAWQPLYGPVTVFLALIGLQWALGLSAFPQATLLSGISALAGAAFLIACVEAMGHPGSVERLVRFQILVLGALALFSIVQFFTWNGRLFWFYEPPYGGVPFGPFNNNNYYPAYVVPAIGPALGLLWTRARGWNPALLGGTTALAAISVLLARSRGGAVALAVTFVAVVVLELWRKGTGPGSARRWLRAGGAVALALILVAAALVGLGRSDEVFQELESIMNAPQEASVKSRVVLWRAAAAMALARPVTGFGMGTFGWALMPYRDAVTTNYSMHAHNEFLEAAAETGVVGLACALAFVGLAAASALRRFRHARSGEETGLRIGAMSGLAGTLAYSLTDFPTALPAVMYLLAFLLAVAIAPLSLPRRRRPTRRSTRRPSKRRGRSEEPRRSSVPGEQPERRSDGMPPQPGDAPEPDWAREQPHPLDDLESGGKTP